MNAPSRLTASSAYQQSLEQVRGADLGKDWYRVGTHFGSLLGPEHDIRVIATGKLFRIGDFTYTRLLKHRAEPTPEGWLEISEEGEPVEYPDEERACSAADHTHQSKMEQFE